MRTDSVEPLMKGVPVHDAARGIGSVGDNSGVCNQGIAVITSLLRLLA